MKYKVFALLFCLFTSSWIWAEEPVVPDLSKEYFTRMIENEKVFLWKIGKYAEDEKGYKSLRSVDESDGGSIAVKEEKFYGLVITLNDASYKLSSMDPCSTLSQAAKQIKSILKSKIMCAFELRGSEPYMIVVGENTNEIVKEIKQDRQNANNIHPSWYDYQVIR